MYPLPVLRGSFKQDDKPKATVALDYTYGRRSGNGAAKDIAHIWELGGGKKLQSLVSVPITAEHLSSSVIAIVLDLSKPSMVLESLTSWMTLVRERVSQCMDERRRTHEDEVNELLAKARKRVGSKHADVASQLVDVCPVPLLILATKYATVLLVCEDAAGQRVVVVGEA